MQENPFADLIPNANSASQQAANPFADLIPNAPANQPKPSYLQQALNAPVELAAGSQEGLKRFGAGIGQLAYPVIDKVLGTKLSPALEAERKRDEKAYQQNFGGSTNAKIGEIATESLPYMAVPGGATGGLVRRLATGGLSGAGIGAAQYVPEGGSRGMNAAVGGLTGGVLPPVLSSLMSKNPYVKAGTGAALGGLAGGLSSDSFGGGAEGAAIGTVIPFLPGAAGNSIKSGLNKLLGRGGLIASPIDQAAVLDVLKNVNPERAMATNEAAKRLGVNITPAEAAGSPYAAKVQGKLGTSGEGALALADFAEKRALQEKKSIRGLLDTISKDDGMAAADIRAAAKGSISEKERALSKIAKPLYDEAFYRESGKLKTLPPGLYNQFKADPLIGQAMKKIRGIPAYQKELDGASPRSYKYLDYVKRYLDDVNEGLIRNGEKNQSRILMQTKSDLIGTLDKVNPAYKNARSVYSAEAKPLAELRESNLGVLANLDDTKLKRVSKIIFDPQQTDLKVLGKLRDEISAKNPMAWRRIIRNELEGRLDKVGVNSGSSFYKKVLESDRGFNQFIEAAKGMPDVQQKLKDMRLVFKDLLNPETTKGAAGKAKSSLDVPRSSAEMLMNAAKNIAGGKYDQAAIKLITSGKWDKEFKAIHKIKNADERTKKLAVLLGRVTGSRMINTMSMGLE